MTTTPTPPTYVPFNQPASHDHDSRAGIGSPSAVVGDVNRDAGGDEQVVRLVEVVPNLYPAVQALCDAHAQGSEVLVLTQPHLVAAVMELLHHGSSNASVAGRSEGKGSVGSASDDPAETTYAHRTLTDHLEDLLRVDEILANRFPTTQSKERIRVAVEIVGALKWGAL